MITFIRKKLAKFLLIGRLERDAYQQEMNAAYDEQIIDDLNVKIEDAEKEIEKIEPQITDCADAHEYEKRKQCEKLKKDKETQEKIIKNLQDMNALVIQAASNERQKAAQAKHRAAFIRKNF